MQWTSQQRRTIPACLLSPRFFILHGRGGWCHISTTSPDSNHLGNPHTSWAPQLTMAGFWSLGTSAGHTLSYIWSNVLPPSLLSAQRWQQSQMEPFTPLFSVFCFLFCIMIPWLVWQFPGISRESPRTLLDRSKTTSFPRSVEIKPVWPTCIVHVRMLNVFTYSFPKLLAQYCQYHRTPWRIMQSWKCTLVYFFPKLNRASEWVHGILSHDDFFCIL